MEKEEARDRERARAAAEAQALVGIASVELEPWVDPHGVPPVPAGGARVARIDTGRAGEGGETAAEAARHLADRDDRLSATPESSTFHRDDQVQRIDSARTRSSWEDRRSTTRPMELSFVVTGNGRELERRPKSDLDAVRGALASHQAQREGSPAPVPVSDGQTSPPSDSGGIAAPGLGTRMGHEAAAHRIAARVATARPDLPQAAVSVPAATRDKVRDDVDSRQAVASAVEAIVHASYAGGAAGTGAGGSQGGGAPGAGGTSGAGSHPRPLGAGTSDWLEFDTTDPVLAGYFRRLKAKMTPALARAFPKQAALDLKQGFVILELNIAHDGAIEAKLVRPSGIEEYDRNCITALRAITPEPIPAASPQPTLKVRGRFEASNPIIK